jgi:hypothetical protein
MIPSDRLSEKSVRWIALLGGPLLSLASFVLVYRFDPLHFADAKPMAAIPAVFLSISILIIMQSISAELGSHRAAVRSDEICETIRNHMHVVPVGSPEHAFRYISSRVPELREVKNTSFNVLHETERADEKLYNAEIYTQTAKQIATFCSRNLIWKDIGDGVGIPRLRKIHNLCIERAKAKKHGYSYKLISHDEPQMNFIILEYMNGDREALFNWDFRGTGQDPRVLLSREPDIVEMFSVQFALLWRHASPDHDIHSTASQPVGANQDSHATRSTSTKYDGSPGAERT